MVNDKHAALHEIAFDLRKTARDKLSGNWLKLFAGYLCFYLLTSGISLMLIVFFPGKFYFTGTNQMINLPWVAFIFVIIMFGPMRLGLFEYTLKFFDEGKIRWSLVLNGFRHIIKSMGVYVIKTCLVFWPMILVVVSAFMYLIVFATASNVGNVLIYRPVFFVIFMVLFFVAFVIAVIYVVYAKLRLSMAMIILGDDESKCALECLRESSEIMHGHKTELLFLLITYLGWYLAALVPAIVITLVINYLFPNQYLQIITLPVALAWLITLIPLVVVKEYVLSGIMGFYRRVSAQASR